MSEHKINIHIANWPTNKEALASIRHQVFIEEQNVPEELEWDEHDATATHFLVSIENKNIACARLSTEGKIGRMAVLNKHRNRGTGSKLLQFIINHATDMGFKKLHLHAQINAVAFYERHGFTANGEIFYEANIPHREMFRKVC